MSALLYLVAGAVSVYVIVYYSLFRGARCSSAVKLKGKTAIVTGNEPHLSVLAKTTLFKWSSTVACLLSRLRRLFWSPTLLNPLSPVYVITNLNLNFPDKNVEIQEPDGASRKVQICLSLISFFRNQMMQIGE